jgi:predicted flap endonuclease-1-like 5' DNA nuclease
MRRTLGRLWRAVVALAALAFFIMFVIDRYGPHTWADHRENLKTRLRALPENTVPTVAPETVRVAEPVVAATTEGLTDQATSSQAEEVQATRRAADLVDIEGIGPAHAEKLKAQGLRTTDDLLRAGASPKGRDDLAAATGISGKLILRWVNRADLFRVRGVGEQFSDLLEAAGVDTVPELAQRRADNLIKKMAEVNVEKKLVRRLPTESQVAGWIESAKGLPRVVTY